MQKQHRESPMYSGLRRTSYTIRVENTRQEMNTLHSTGRCADVCACMCMDVHVCMSVCMCAGYLAVSACLGLCVCVVLHNFITRVNSHNHHNANTEQSCPHKDPHPQHLVTLCVSVYSEPEGTTPLPTSMHGHLAGHPPCSEVPTRTSSPAVGMEDSEGNPGMENLVLSVRCGEGDGDCGLPSGADNGLL